MAPKQGLDLQVGMAPLDWNWNMRSWDGNVTEILAKMEDWMDRMNPEAVRKLKTVQCTRMAMRSFQDWICD